MRFARAKTITGCFFLAGVFLGVEGLAGYRLIDAIVTDQVVGKGGRAYTFADEPFAAWFVSAQWIFLLVGGVFLVAVLSWLAFPIAFIEGQPAQERPAAPFDVARRGPAVAGQKAADENQSSLS